MPKIDTPYRRGAGARERDWAEIRSTYPRFANGYEGGNAEHENHLFRLGCWWSRKGLCKHSYDIFGNENFVKNDKKKFPLQKSW